MLKILTAALDCLPEAITIKEQSTGKIVFQNSKAAAVGVSSFASTSTFPFSIDSDGDGEGENKFELFCSKSPFEEEALATIEYLPHVVWYTDANGNTEYVNKYCMDYCGVGMDEMRGAGWLNFVHKDDLDKVQESWEKVAQVGDEYLVEYRFKRSDGAYRWFYDRGRALKDKDGKIIRWYGISSDVHDRKMYEEKYAIVVAVQQQERKLLKSILHQMPVGVIVSDPSGRICYLNKMVPNIASEETWNSIKSIEDYGQFQGVSYDTGKVYSAHDWPLARALLNGEFVTTDRVSIVDESGRRRIISISANPIYNDNTGLVENAVGLIEDITDRIAWEEERLQSLSREKAALEASRLKTQFLAHMSHEIRTPLNGVIGMTELLLQDSDLNEEQKDGLSTIHTSGNHLLSVINDILDLSKIESGKFELDIVPFNVHHLLLHCKQIVSICALKKNVNLVFDNDTRRVFTDPLFLLGDGQRLQQVLINLVGNAIKFTSAHKTVKVRLTTYLEDTDNYCNLKIFVEDEGIGMNEKTLQNLYSPFHQADSSYTKKFEGTGLGLSICKHIIDLMGGSITVKSEIGIGTTFIVDISLEVSHDHDCENSISRNSPLKTGINFANIRILIAEDNQVNQQVIKRILKKSGFVNFEIVDNGKLAFDKYKEIRGKYDIIFMDCQMPVLDGFQATQMIRKFERSKDIRQTPIVALTAGAWKSDENACFVSGMNEFISKPFTAAQVVNIIKKLTAKV